MQCVCPTAPALKPGSWVTRQAAMPQGQVDQAALEVQVVVVVVVVVVGAAQAVDVSWFFNF